MFGVTDAVTVAIVDASWGRIREAPGRSPAHAYLTSVANMPVIAHVLQGLAGGGIERAVILTAVRTVARELADVLGDEEAFGMRLSYLGPEGKAQPEVISALRAAVDDRPAIIHPGQCLFPGQLPGLQTRFIAEGLDLVMLAESGPQAVQTAAAARRPLHRAGDRQAAPTAARRLAAGQLAATAMIVGPAAWAVLDRLPCQPSQPLEFLGALANAGCRVGVCDLGEHWCYCDSTEQLLAANRMLLDARGPDQHETKLVGGNEIHGRVEIDASARVTDSRLHGPVLIGPDAHVEDSFIGPFTAVGARASVVGAEIENAILLAAARVRYPGQRLEACLIGERALVTRSFALPRALHLRLGSDASVILN